MSLTTRPRATHPLTLPGAPVPADRPHGGEITAAV
jgi:hypothetical protein